MKSDGLVQSGSLWFGKSLISEFQSGLSNTGLIVATASPQFTTEYGRGSSEKNLRRMIQFAEVFPDQNIVVPLIRQLSWTPFLRPFIDSWKRNGTREIVHGIRRLLEKKP